MLICITGQIGSGKTSLLNEFKSVKKVMNLDEFLGEIARRVAEKA